MLDFVNNILKKFVGSKADRDFKELSPFVPRINEYYDTLSNLSNDALKKDRNALIEEVLLEIHAEAFAVVKEAARRFKEHTELEVTPMQHDRDLAAKKANVIIRNDKAYYQNSWIAAGNMVTWDMVHYDAQLIGGTVLHQGKIAEMATGEGKTLVATLPI